MYKTILGKLTTKQELSQEEVSNLIKAIADNKVSASQSRVPSCPFNRN
ncbi:MAG: hypothetical protein LBD57_01035 [Endomicrobium sp.]|nr:hypothetical protein [Endomicrobium sp.]